MNIFRHEKSHFDVWQKYGVDSKLYHIPKTKGYFVMDVNLEDVSKEKKYDESKVMQILKEMMGAPFINKKEVMEEHLLDILYFEILEGNIERLHKNDFEKAFSKYKWKL